MSGAVESIEIVCCACGKAFSGIPLAMLAQGGLAIRCGSCGTRLIATLNGTTKPADEAPAPTTGSEPPTTRKTLDQVLEPVDIHGLPADKVKQRQEATAQALKQLPAFRDDIEGVAKGPVMVVIPSGRFLRGSVPGELGHEVCESPRQLVTITRPFAIGKFAVTFRDWAVFEKHGGGDRPDDDGWGQDLRPVINVSVADASAYLDWLSRATGHTYRLPTEAEWEYACRAGTSSAFHTGDHITPVQANMPCPELSPEGQPAAVTAQTRPVGSYAPNAWGLHDMHGNIWEWTEDCWNSHYIGSPLDGSAWSIGDCSRAVIRGGFWNSYATDMRSASRARVPRELRMNAIGFRVVREFEI